MTDHTSDTEDEEPSASRDEDAQASGSNANSGANERPAMCEADQPTEAPSTARNLDNDEVKKSDTPHPGGAGVTPRRGETGDDTGRETGGETASPILIRQVVRPGLVLALVGALGVAVAAGIILRPNSGSPPKPAAVLHQILLVLGARHVRGDMAIRYSPHTDIGSQLDLFVGLRVPVHHVVEWQVNVWVAPGTTLTTIPTSVHTAHGRVEVRQTPKVTFRPKAVDARFDGHEWVDYVVSGSVTGPSDAFGLLSRGLNTVSSNPQDFVPFQYNRPLPYISVPLRVTGKQPIAYDGSFVTVSLPAVVTQTFAGLGPVADPAASFQAEAEAAVGDKFSPYLGTETQAGAGLWDWRSPGDLNAVVGTGVDEESQRENQNSAFYSGVAFGVAGNAAIAILVALLGWPLLVSRRTPDAR